jgi:hypothetical protein
VYGGTIGEGVFFVIRIVATARALTIQPKTFWKKFQTREWGKGLLLPVTLSLGKRVKNRKNGKIIPKDFMLQPKF